MKGVSPNDFWFELSTGPGDDGRPVRYYKVRCRKCSFEAAYHANALTPDGLRKQFMAKGWEIGKTSLQHICPNCLEAKRDARQEKRDAKKFDREIRKEEARLARALNRLEAVWVTSSAPERAKFCYAHLDDFYNAVMPTANKRYKLNELIAMLESQARAESVQSEGAAYIARLAETYAKPTLSVVPAASATSAKSVDDFLAAVKTLDLNTRPKAYIDDAGFQHGAHIDSMPQEANVPPPVETQVTVPPVADDDDEPADWWKELQKR